MKKIIALACVAVGIFSFGEVEAATVGVDKIEVAEAANVGIDNSEIVELGPWTKFRDHLTGKREREKREQYERERRERWEREHRPPPNNRPHYGPPPPPNHGPHQGPPPRW